MPALRDVVVDLPLVFLAAQFAGDLGGEFVGEREEDLGAEGLQAGSARFRPARSSASELMLWVATMGMHLDWRERAKNFSSPFGSFSPSSGEVLVFVADEEYLPKVLVGIVLDLRNAVQEARWKSSFIMTPMALASPGFRGDRKVQGTDLAGFDQLRERRQRSPVSFHPR